MRILLIQINPTIGDLEGNTQKIIHGINQAKTEDIDIVVFPEMAICGYPPEDFLLLPSFIEAIERKLDLIIHAASGITVIVGLPRKATGKGEKSLYNSAAVITNQHLIGFQDKALLPTYDVFSERRYFEPAGEIGVWTIDGKKIGITICEDIWEHSHHVIFSDYNRDPIIELVKLQPDFVINISASPYSLNKFERRLDVVSQAAKTLQCPILLCNQVGGDDSLIFDGYSLYVGSDGQLINHAKGFEEDQLLVDLSEKLPPAIFEVDVIQDLYKALVLGLRDYFVKSRFKKACFGLSGGIDSALVACLAAEALGPQNVLAVLMPSRYSSEGSLTDSIELVKNLDIQHRIISIEEPFETYLNVLTPYFEGKPADVTEENMQSRIRGFILMSLSNKLGHIVLSPGNKSELAMGYATLYGDTVGGLGVINDLTKRQVYALANWINREGKIIPQKIIEKVPSAELRPNQKDSDSLPEYDIIDNVLQEYVEDHRSAEEISLKYDYPMQLVMDIIKKIHQSEYKRRQSAPGLRVTEKSFSVGRRFPIVQGWV